MRIVVASGKGGTGKTTVATNLAHVASLDGRTVAYVDCDVEAPNGHLFLKPDWTVHRVVTRPVPRVDETKCTHCGRCHEACQFSAIVPLGVTVLVYAELCHGCGGCVLACGNGAISEAPREIGTLEMGWSAGVQLTQGLLNVGEAMSTPLIRQVKAAPPRADFTVIDAPPGTSCPVIESVRGADYVLLVTEPTPFGLNDLRLAVEMVRVLGLPLGVVVNRAESDARFIRDYCEDENIPILAEIPDDRTIAEAYSRGRLASSVSSKYRAIFADLAGHLAKIVVQSASVLPAGQGSHA